MTYTPDLALLTKSLNDVKLAIDSFSKKNWRHCPANNLERFEHELWRLEEIDNLGQPLADSIHKYLTERKASHDH